ncbi:MULTISPECIES: hypothetical protein [unclassified Streptomyces]|uniref:hypothetical protein n=1 Tax=unclassified Streptomyces TaxID=2593676 RepID=UPI003C79F839
MCTALYLVHSEEFADTGYVGTWIQCELDPSHATETHEGEEAVWSDTMPGARPGLARGRVGRRLPLAPVPLLLLHNIRDQVALVGDGGEVGEHRAVEGEQ